MTDDGRVMHLRGRVLPSDVLQDVFIVGGRITFSERADACTVLESGYLVPGLVDAHAHLSLASPAGDQAAAPDRVQASARAQLNAGVLAIREPGSPDYFSRDLGPEVGLPRTVTAGRMLVRPGRYFPGLGREVSPDQLPEAAVEEARASGAWAKVIADFPEPGGRITTTFPQPALAEAARRVHALGARIAAHAACAEAIDACVTAGFDSIEHGTLLQEDQISSLVERGVTLVPTLIIAEGILGAVQAFGGDERAVRATRRALEDQPSVVRAAADRGVVVLAGTDAGMGPHGQIATEIRLLLEAGLSPEQALAAGSWQARDYLGWPGIDEGAPADLVAYADDPRQDMEVLRRPRLILLDGRRVPLPNPSVD